MIDRIRTTIAAFWANEGTGLTILKPLRNMALSEPKPGHLPPQPNEDLAVTRAVQRLLGLDSKHGK